MYVQIYVGAFLLATVSYEIKLYIVNIYYSCVEEGFSDLNQIFKMRICFLIFLYVYFLYLKLIFINFGMYIIIQKIWAEC